MFRDLVLGGGIAGVLVIAAALAVLLRELGRGAGTNRPRDAHQTPPGADDPAAEAQRQKREPESESGPGPESESGPGPESESESELEPEPPNSPREGRVLAALRPRGLVLVDDMAEPAAWRGPGDPPARGAAVSLTRSAGTDGWLAWPLTGPAADAASNQPPVASRRPDETRR